MQKIFGGGCGVQAIDMNTVYTHLTMNQSAATINVSQMIMVCTYENLVKKKNHTQTYTFL